MDTVIQWFEQHPNLFGLTLMAGFVLAAVMLEVLIRRVVLRLVRNTETELDDEILKRFRIPLILSLACVGLHYGLKVSTFSWIGIDILDVLLIALAVVIWLDAVIKFITSAAQRTGTDLDDEIIGRLKRPLSATAIFVSVHYVAVLLSLTILASKVIDAALVTLGVAMWIDAFTKIARAIAKRTKTDLDDEIVQRVRWPLAATVIFIGARVIVGSFQLGGSVNFIVTGVLVTLAMVLWSQAFVRVGTAILNALSAKATRFRLVQPQTLPLFDIVLKGIVYGGAAYGIFLAWNINVTAWLASAGIVGIAVGFAAKDTLANLFAGIFIIADAPYKLGDFINLDSGERGMVTDIGIRSTRLLTRDDIEVIIPNAHMGNAKIVNETAGPHKKLRVRVTIGVSYKSDIDKVREVLMDVASQSSYLNKDLEPRVRFRTFDDSALTFQLMGWIDEPVLRGRALDELNASVFKNFKKEGIEIPFPQRDIWFKNILSQGQDEEVD